MRTLANLFSNTRNVRPVIEAIADYFANIPSSHRSLMLVGGIAFFWCLESAVPLFRFRYNKWRHAGVNLIFTLTTIAINFSLAFLLLRATEWAQANHFGLLGWLGTLPIFLQLVIGLLLLDLIGAYLAHWVEHKIDLLWRFHAVHHSDPFVDTTTANRHHPGESVIRFAFTTLAVVVAGAPIWMVMLYQSLSVALSQFNHANIGLPPSVDRWLSLVIVTPDMHHVHHHREQPLTDRNFGNIFSIWDRLFGTFAVAPKESLVYGIDSHPDAAENSSLKSLFLMPFRAEKTER